MTDSVRNRLGRGWPLAAVAGVALLMVGALMLRSGSGRADAPVKDVLPPNSEAVVAVAVAPTILALSTPATKPAPPPVPEPERRAPKPAGPIVAEPYRAYTGDGDCLNVRPAPIKAFATDPRTCVPEGFLLWLYGPAKEADGETWRYALGEGWVAARYVRPDPTALTGFGSLKGLLVTTSDNVDTTVSRVRSNGSVEPLTGFGFRVEGLGSLLPGYSPDGEWFAFTQQEGYRPVMTVGRMAGDEVKKYPGLVFASWSTDNKIRVNTNEQCPQVCGIWGHGWLDPKDGANHRIEGLDRDTSLVWGHDGRYFIAVSQKVGIMRVDIDGTNTPIVKVIPEGFQFGEMTVSPDGTKLLSSATLGKIQVVDLRTGSLSAIDRAKQIQVAGKCGGASGRLSGWLDERTVIWHESYAEKGGNGITLAGIDGSNRRVLPFFSISDVRVITRSLVSFTTFESEEQGPGFPLSWLLDVKSGEARPISVGSAAAWLR